MQHSHKLLIDGRLTDGAGTLDVVNPATGMPFITVPRADESHGNTAIASAKGAFQNWSSLPYPERAQYVVRFAAALEQRKDVFTTMLTREQGKPLAQARFEIDLSVAQLRWAASQQLSSHVLRENGSEKIIEQYDPLGVVAAIALWNFPVWIVISKVGAALMAGNTVIAKPAPTTLMLGEIAAEIFPRGVFQTLVDQNDLGELLTSHPDVAFVSFTGSIETGKKVLSSSAATLKRTTLELGGNDAAIVLDDIDVDLVAPQVYAAAFLNAGQVCFAAKRVYVPNAIFDAFVARLVDLVRAEKLGDGLADATTMGPVQSKAQFGKVRSYIEGARAKGTIVAGGERVDGSGFFIPPTIVTGLADDDALVVEEQFGPFFRSSAMTIWTTRSPGRMLPNMASARPYGPPIRIAASRSQRRSMPVPSGSIPISHCRSTCRSAARSTLASAVRAAWTV